MFLCIYNNQLESGGLKNLLHIILHNISDDIADGCVCRRPPTTRRPPPTTTRRSPFPSRIDTPKAEPLKQQVHN